MEEEVRKIIHVDMDAFYASVEQRDNPELKGIPLAVGGTGGRGVIAAASYEARKYGVHSAMPSRVALRKCPMLHFVAPNFDKYARVSQEIHEIFHRYTSVIEPLALDEAFLDVTYSDYEIPSATIIAQQIKEDIKKELNLIASAGVSYNKFLAKMASDEDKPDGLFVITPEKGAEYVQELAIEKFFGVGKVTAERLQNDQIYKGADLLPYSKWQLQHKYGKIGGFLYNVVRGIDNREVKAHRIRKSVGVENTFNEDITDELTLNEEFTLIFDAWWTRYQRQNRKGKSVTLKVRNEKFETHTKSYTDPSYVTDKAKIRKQLKAMLKEITLSGMAVRLIGVSISGFEKEEEGNLQLTLW